VSFLDEKLYQQACAAKRGEAELAPSSVKLAGWLRDGYAVRLVYLLLDEIDIGPAAGRPRLWLFLEGDEDVAKLQDKLFTFRPGVAEAIQEQVVACGLLSRVGRHGVHIAQVDFTYEAIDDEDSDFLAAHARQLADELATSGVWRITGACGRVVVFYLAQDDVDAKAESGESDAIARRCYDLLKPHDEFDYLALDDFPFVFDSKENLDANYEGSEYYYFL
jgi:hypothetical protein